MGVADMVTGRSAHTIRYYPEPVNQPNGSAITGETPDQNHMVNFIDCVLRVTPQMPPWRLAIARRWLHIWPISLIVTSRA
jgi:hypothetical protein